MRSFFDTKLPVLENLANLAVFVGIIFALVTVIIDKTKIETDTAQKSAEFVFKLDDMLEKYQDLIEYLDTEDSKIQILEPSGKFSSSHIEGYLGVYELMGDLFKRGILISSMVDNAFSYDIERACSNETIMDYVAKCRKQDCNLYLHFLMLCNHYKKVEEANKEQHSTIPLPTMN